MCVCVAKPVAVELRCHATALIIHENAHLHRYNVDVHRHDSSCVMRKPAFAYVKIKAQISCAVIAAVQRLCLHR